MASAAGREEKDVFNAYLTKHHLKRSEQREVILDAYRHAVAAGYRFYSYGDATLIE